MQISCKDPPRLLENMSRSFRFSEKDYTKYSEHDVVAIVTCIASHAINKSCNLQLYRFISSLVTSEDGNSLRRQIEADFC